MATPGVVEMVTGADIWEFGKGPNRWPADRFDVGVRGARDAQEAPRFGVGCSGSSGSLGRVESQAQCCLSLTGAGEAPGNCVMNDAHLLGDAARAHLQGPERPSSTSQLCTKCPVNDAVTVTGNLPRVL